MEIDNGLVGGPLLGEGLGLAPLSPTPLNQTYKRRMNDCQFVWVYTVSQKVSLLLS